MKTNAKILPFFLGAALVLSIVLVWNAFTKKTEDKVQNDFYIITNQIRKMNKIVVIEQDFSSMQKTKITSELLGGMLPSM